MLFEIIYKIFICIVATVAGIFSFDIFLSIGSPVLAFLSIVFWIAITIIHFKFNLGPTNYDTSNSYAEVDKTEQIKKELEFNGINADNYNNIGQAVNDMHAMWDEMD